MISKQSCVSTVTIAILLGQGSLTGGSLLADDVSPVAADLVDLALAIPEVVTAVEGAEKNRKRLEQLSQKGFITGQEAVQKQRELAVASRKLELLRILVDAELQASEVRSEFLRARHEAAGTSTPERIAAAQQRLNVLKLLREACEVPTAEDGQAAVHPIDLPPTEAINANPVLVTDADTP